MAISRKLSRKEASLGAHWVSLRVSCVITALRGDRGGWAGLPSPFLNLLKHHFAEEGRSPRGSERPRAPSQEAETLVPSAQPDPTFPWIPHSSQGEAAASGWALLGQPTAESGPEGHPWEAGCPGGCSGPQAAWAGGRAGLLVAG